jgi:hypothetical protein
MAEIELPSRCPSCCVREDRRRGVARARARRFAVHALGQVERGDGRYSLWTGDIGAAVFAADCLDAEARYPVLG